MVIGKAAEKKATRTSVKGSISSVDNLLKRSMLYFSSSDKKVVFKDSNFFVSLLQHCSREREREREKERERKREREKKRKRETERDTERQRGRERQRDRGTDRDRERQREPSSGNIFSYFLPFLTTNIFCIASQYLF